MARCPTCRRLPARPHASRCHEAGQGGEGALALQRWMSGVEAAAREGLPTSMSTDEEGAYIDL